MKTLILGDFNMQPTNQILETFFEDNSFVNQIKPVSIIDLIVTNKPKSFQNIVMETGIGDHHALISFLKTAFTKIPQNKFQYRN